jgi:anaerobic carbon-monoxide dehydrogenase iron sulfur subunit
MTANHRTYIESIPQNCSGCRLCELCCSTRHNPELTNPKKSRIRIEIEHRENRNVPRVCAQCPAHPCLESCPVEAIQLHSELRIPVVDPEVCSGCRACVEACPQGTMFFDEELSLALKCDLCGGDPECVKNCPMEAIRLHPAA